MKRLGWVVAGALTGGALGGILGAALTHFNNQVLVPAGGAATGSYRFWINFFTIPGAALGVMIGAALALRRRRTQ